MLEAVTALLLVWPALAEEQAPARDGWDDLAGLPAGRKIQLVGRDGTVRAGRFGSWSDTMVTVQLRDAEGAFSKEEVGLVRAMTGGAYHTVYAPWSNLDGLAHGRALNVHRAGKLPLRGAFAGCSAAGITLDTGKQVFIPREKISKVSLWLGNKSEEGGEIGAVAGFFAGLALMLAGCSQGGCPSNGIAPDALDPLAQGGHAIGEAVGGLFPNWQTIYVAPKR